ncbi:MAG: Ig-like domain-containing protein [Ruminococcus sp.]|nr:Ig-like domain-containing protein [Ruminococcus sp.]MDE7138636.1 Ig-like domain-containing protein [Ruminococcus sp.]
MIVKRIISAVTGIAVLASTATVLSGCGSLEEFFNGESKNDSENSAGTEDTVAASTEDGVITNGEWLAMVNDAFGMEVDESAEDGEVQAAKEWGVIGEDENIDLNSPVDDKFVTSTLMRASGYADLDSSDEEIIQAAVEHGVITSPTESVSSPEQAVTSLSTAQHEWSNKTFDEHYDIQLADNVTDLTQTLNVTDVEMKSSDSMVIPSSSAENIVSNSIVIVPQKDDYDGTAYKVVSVKQLADGKSEIKCAPATFEEVYKDIDVSGVFSSIENVEPAEGVSYEFVDTNLTATQLSNTETGEIQPLVNFNGEKQIKDLVFKKRVGAVDLEAGVKDIRVTTKVDVNVFPKKRVNEIYVALDYTEYVSASTGFVFGKDEDGNVNIFNLDKKVDEASLELGEIDIHICTGLAIAIKASLSFDATGEAKVVLSIANKKGFEMRGDAKPRSINENSPKAELAINGQLGAYFNLTLALVPSFLKDIELVRVTLKIGPKLKAELKWDSDTEIACTQINSWLIIELSVGFLETFFKDCNVTLLKIDEDNNPIKLFDVHLENFEKVPECTVNGEKTTEAATEEATIPVGIFSLEKSYVSIDVGSSAKLAIESLPSGYSVNDIVWESSNPSVASVDANGNISANSAGTTSITVKTKDGKYSASCAVNAKSDIVVNNNMSQENRNYSESMAA